MDKITPENLPIPTRNGKIRAKPSYGPVLVAFTSLLQMYGMYGVSESMLVEPFRVWSSLGSKVSTHVYAQ